MACVCVCIWALNRSVWSGWISLFFYDLSKTFPVFMFYSHDKSSVTQKVENKSTETVTHKANYLFLDRYSFYDPIHSHIFEACSRF